MNEDNITERVITAVADKKGVSEDTLPQLYDSVDPDALQSLYDHQNTIPDTELQVQFCYAECIVMVSPNAEVSVEE